MKLYQIRDTNDSIFLFLFSLYVASFVNALVSYDLKGNDMLPKLLMFIAILQSHKIFSKRTFMKMSN
jgi:hypothetical protein